MGIFDSAESLDSSSPRLPEWWLRFADQYPALPTALALLGLAAVGYLLAPDPDAARDPEGSVVIGFIAALTQSEFLVQRAADLREVYHHWFSADVRAWLRALYSNPALYLAIPFLWLLERLFPANPNQRQFGKAFAQDFIWFIALVGPNILVLNVAIELLARVYENYFSFLTIRSAVSWPAPVQVGAALFVGEFLAWFSHLVRHKVGSLWLFHAVHHSQRDVNIFTDDRVHLVDRLASEVVTFIPLLMFQAPHLYAIGVIAFYRSIHNRFVHANLRVNLGWLGWVIASPQFHRVHHSADPRHADKNFGAMLSIFDYAFGTGVRDRDIYPETGVSDPAYPQEERLQWRDLPLNWIRQNVHPFLQLARVWVAPRA